MKPTASSTPILCLLLLSLLASCATQIAPSGGPPDTTPPAIIETEPENGTTRFSGQSVRFRFDEYVDHNSFQQSVHVSPLVMGTIKYDWSGKSVQMIFPDTLESNKTYVISIGTDVKDVHAGNKLDRTYNLAFSTGDSLDRATISGRVYDPQPSGISLFAWQLDTRLADTLNPAHQRPDYAVMTGTDGSFRFKNIAAGNYMVMAVRDKQKNFLYDVENDEIGIPTSGSYPALQTDSVGRFVILRMSHEDTSRPYIQTVEAITSRSIRIKFNEELLLPTCPDSVLFLRDSTTRSPIGLIGMRRIPDRKFSWLLFTKTELDSVLYEMEAVGVQDAAGNRLTEPARFYGTRQPDTLRPSFAALSPAVGSKEYPMDSLFRFHFTKPMMRSGIVSMTDSSNTVVPLSATWESPFDCNVSHGTLVKGRPYALTFDLRSYRDSLFGKSIADSILTIRFTAKEEIPGNISGEIINPADSAAEIAVELVPTAQGASRMKTRTTGHKKFRFDPVPAGTYTIDAYSDPQKLGRWNGGRSHPFSPSQPRCYPADTIRVRAGWETKDVKLRFP